MRPLILVLVVAALQVGLTALSEATMLIVDGSGGGDFETIQGAVDAAATVDSILIRAGQYDENVLSVGKHIVFLGEGVGQTIIQGVSDAPTIELRELDDPPWSCWFHEMTVRAGPLDEWAVYWTERSARFYSCSLEGTVGSWESSSHGTACLYNCTATSVRTRGPASYAEIENSVVDSARFRGAWVTNQWGFTFWSSHGVETYGSQIGTLELEGGRVESHGDVIESVQGDIYGRFYAWNSEIGSICVGAGLRLTECTVVNDAQLVGGYPSHHTVAAGVIEIDDSFIGGDLYVEVHENGIGAQRQAWVSHTTVLGDMTCDYEHSESWTTFVSGIRGNIVMGSTFLNLAFIETPVVSHNDFVGGAEIWGDQSSVYSNISSAPLFCGFSSGDYTLQECSPCAGTAHDGGNMGAYDIGCPCFSVVEEKSWGAIKAMYRN
jgi:hypothetical protein